MKRFLMAALAPLFVFTAAAKPEIVRMTVDYQSCPVTVGAQPNIAVQDLVKPVPVTREGDRLLWTFTIPSNTTAEVHIPGSSKVKNYSSGTYTVEGKL